MSIAEEAGRLVHRVRDMMAHLVPEMLGLAVTPAAVIACLLLLGSSHPARNVAALAGVFFVAYAAFAGVVLVAGRSTGVGVEHDSTVRGWVSLGLGALFVAGAAFSWWHPRRHRAAVVALDRMEARRAGTATTTPLVRERPTAAMDPATDHAAGSVAEPSWAHRLRDPSLGMVVGAGLVLAVVNPNVAILASGLGVVLTAELPLDQQVVGVLLLLGASMVDFAVPVLVFVAAGQRGREWLRKATGWLLVHNHVIGIVVLTAFGVLFASRGLDQLTG